MRHAVIMIMSTICLAAVDLMAGDIVPSPAIQQAPLSLTLSVDASGIVPDAPSANIPTGVLTLGDCIRIGLQKSPVGQSAHEAVIGARESTAVAKAPYWPAVGFSAGYSRWQRHIFLPSGLGQPGQALPSLVGPTDDYSFSLNATYLLWDSGERKAQLGVVKAKQQGSEYEEQRARQDLALAVHQAYYDYESAIEMLAAAKTSLSRAEDHVKIARVRKQAGVVPLSDVLRAEVEASSAHLALVRAEGAARLSRGKLATTMGLPVETPVEIAAPAGPLEPPDETELAYALDQSILLRPAVKAAEQGVEAAKRGVDSARSAWGPKVNAVASYGREDSQWWPQDKNWMAGVIVSIPVFTGFSRIHNVARAKADLARSGFDLGQVKLEVRQQVWNAFSTAKEAYDSVRTSETLVHSATESLRLARERYEVGAGTITDLLDSEDALARAEASLVATKGNLRAAWSRYRWSMGSLFIESPNAK